MISLGANTDPYQPIERELKITRSLLEVMLRFRHPVGIVTKGALVERDIDLLQELAQDGLATVAISITTLKRSEEHTSELQSLMRISLAVVCLTTNKIFTTSVYLTTQNASLLMYYMT